jgi:hypothetical protein
MQPHNWRYSSDGEMRNIEVESKRLDEPLVLSDGKFIITQRKNSGVLQKCLTVGSTRIAWGESHITLIGDMFYSKSGLTVDMEMAVDTLNWSRMQNVFKDKRQKSGLNTKRRQQSNTKATLRVRADRFIYGNYAFSPMEVKVTFESDEVLVLIQNANLCDVTLSGFIKILDTNTEYFLVPASENKELEISLACFSKQKADAAGKFDLDGEIAANIESNSISKSFAGELHFSANNGRIYRLGILAKIFAILNVTEIYRGEVPDLTGEGFAYNSISAEAEFKGNKLLLKECSIDGASMSIVSKGEIDLDAEKINLIVLVAPFKTIDRIVQKIPLVNNILGGKLVSIPFQAYGDIDNYQVIPLSPAVVGSEVLGIMERTLKLPIAIIQPLFPESENKEKGPEPQTMQ